MKTDTKDVFNRIIKNERLPKRSAFYVYKDIKDTIHIGRNVPIDPQNPEQSIKKMQEIENMNGFLFWNNSPEGVEFFKKHGEYISDMFNDYVLNKNNYKNKT